MAFYSGCGAEWSVDSKKKEKAVIYTDDIPTESGEANRLSEEQMQEMKMVVCVPQINSTLV